MATQRPDRVGSMIDVVAAQFADQARGIISAVTEETRSDGEQADSNGLRHGGERSASSGAMAPVGNDREDMNFTPTTLSSITARTLIVHGDRDPLYPVELAVELLRAIPTASLWVVPEGGHGPIFGNQAAPFVNMAAAFFAASQIEN